MDKGKMKKIALYTLSMAFLAVGILGIADVSFFTSNSLLEIIEIVLGISGIICAVR